ncbi:MAG: DNA alkylation repair protein [Bacteroidota bacterium]
MIEQYVADLGGEFEKHADPRIAAGAKAYMLNKWDYYGLPSPLRRQIVKEFIAKAGYPAYGELDQLVHFAWEQPQREWQYTAMEICGYFTKKAQPDLIDLAEWMITNKSWWDTVDYIAPNIAGILFKKYPETRMPSIESWMQSGHLWLQRSCLIHQLRYNDSLDSALLFNLCERLAGHPDFFIRKAIGWSLRQYSKASPEAVIEFVNSHEISNLSRKEALKVISRKLSLKV